MFSELKKELADLSPTRMRTEEIPFFPGPYTMSFGFDLESLMQSIRNIGLLNPPVLAESPEGSMRVVTGYKRVGAMRALEKDMVTCRLVKESHVPPLQLLLLNFHDNLVTRTFNPVEKGMILNRLSHYLSPKEILSNYMEPLGLPRNQEILQSFVAFDEGLQDSLKIHLAQGGFSEQAARMLMNMKSQDREAIGRLISKLNLSINYQRQLIEYTVELSKIDRSDVLSVLKKQPIDQILANTSLNLPQKGRAILDFLKRRRYPTLTEAEETFRKRVSRLSLPGNVNIQPPPYFESGRYSMEIRFRHGKELKAHLDYLVKHPDLESIGDPWKKGQ